MGRATLIFHSTPCFQGEGAFEELQKFDILGMIRWIGNWVKFWTENIRTSTGRPEWDWNIKTTTLTSAPYWSGR